MSLTDDLDPESAVVYAEVAARVPAAPGRTPAQQRADGEAGVSILRGDGAHIDARLRVEEHELGGVDVVTVTPPSHHDVAVVYAHGGGWIEGSATLSVPEVARLALAVGARCISVDYRRAPEHPFPAAIEDVVAVIRAAAAAGARIAVAGDSAGGNLAAAACLALRGSGVPIVAQLLLCPVLDPGSRDTASYRQHAAGPLLTADDMARFAGAYLAGDPAAADDPLAAPLRAHDLSGLPPAVVVTAGHDVLRDEGLEYAARLARSGVRVVSLPNPALGHAFLQLAPRSPTADAALDQAYAAFRRLLEIEAAF